MREVASDRRWWEESRFSPRNNYYVQPECADYTNLQQQHAITNGFVENKIDRTYSLAHFNENTMCADPAAMGLLPGLSGLV